MYVFNIRERVIMKSSWKKIITLVLWFLVTSPQPTWPYAHLLPLIGSQDMYFFKLGRYWLHFGWFVVTWKDEKFKNCFNILQCTSVSGQLWKQTMIHFDFISGIILSDHKLFKYVFNYFVRQELKSILKFYNWPARERKILKMAASRECWSLQIYHCHFGYHWQHKLLKIKSAKKQWSQSFSTLSKGLKLRRISGMRVTLKLISKIAQFKSVFSNKIGSFLKNYNIKQLFCLLLFIKRINIHLQC